MGQTFRFTVDGGYNLGTVTFAIDPLSAWFILIVNLTLVNGTIYGIGYMKPYADRKSSLALHWILLVLFHASMVWVCELRNSLAFLILWEIMTLTSFLLVMFEQDSKTVKAGLNYLVQMHIGVALLSIAFIWIYVKTGTFDFQGMDVFLGQAASHWVPLLFFVGFGIKAGFVPFHTWLPHAHPAAPSHISGIMSGVIVKMGIYGILRTLLMVRYDYVTSGVVVVFLSAVTALYGILNASVHRDLKKMLAFCTSENIGIVGMGIGLALIGKGIGNPAMSLLGLSAALLHTLNHSLYKSLLFFTAGNIYQQTHTRNMEQLGGLIREMPQTALLFFAGMLGIAGLPPFNGFVSKFLVYSGFIESFRTHQVMISALLILCAAILAMAGGVSILAFTKSFGTVFLGTPHSNRARPAGEVSLIMRLPLYFIVTLMLLIGLFPEVILRSLHSILLAFDPQTDQAFALSAIQPVTLVGRSSLVLIMLILVMWLIRRWIGSTRKSEWSPTWGCGYVAPTPAMPYTGRSYSKNLARLFGFITLEGKKYRELKEGSIFPSPRSYRSFYMEFFETRLIDPFLKLFLRIFTYFRFIHNGRIQNYVLYGFFFVIVFILLSIMRILN
jgi:formate hydrogenlyase subunit 3/multisubunit Na+/H+ antiporter MnhD subunit